MQDAGARQRLPLPSTDPKFARPGLMCAAGESGADRSQRERAAFRGSSCKWSGTSSRPSRLPASWGGRLRRRAGQGRV